MEEIDRLREERKRLWKEVKRSRVNSKRASNLCNALNRRYERDRNAHEEVDRQLAMLDGRYQKIEERKKKPTKPVRVEDLTYEQLLEVHERLGINFGELSFKDEEDL